MDQKGRLTKQGIRDLNYYGPRRKKDEAPATVANEETAPKAPPPVTAAAGRHDEGGIE